MRVAAAAAKTSRASCSAENQMDSRIRINGSTHRSDLQTKCSFLKRFLHLPSTKGPQVAASLCRTTVGILGSELLKRLLTRFDLSLVALEYFKRFFFRSGNVVRAPTCWPTRFPVFHQQMGGLHLVLGESLGRLGGHFPLRLLRE